MFVKQLNKFVTVLTPMLQKISPISFTTMRRSKYPLSTLFVWSTNP